VFLDCRYNMEEHQLKTHTIEHLNYTSLQIYHSFFIVKFQVLNRHEYPKMKKSYMIHQHLTLKAQNQLILHDQINQA
jgi:hypothetical protein